MKSARVVPLYKKEVKTYEGNYKPVSIMSIVSKVMERLRSDQVEVYVKQNNIMYEFHPGAPSLLPLFQ